MFLTLFYTIKLKPSKEAETGFNHTFLTFIKSAVSHVSRELSNIILWGLWVKGKKVDKSSLRYCFSIPKALTTIELSSFMIPIWAKISVFINASFGFSGFHGFSSAINIVSLFHKGF